VDEAVEADFAPNNLLKAIFRGIWDNFCVHVSIAFKDTEDDGFLSGSLASFAFGTAGSEVRFINFNLTTEG
jgi:hypothetical protein